MAERRPHLPKNGGAAPAPPFVRAARVARPRPPAGANDNRAPLKVRLTRWLMLALPIAAAMALAYAVSH